MNICERDGEFQLEQLYCRTNSSAQLCQVCLQQVPHTWPALPTILDGPSMLTWCYYMPVGTDNTPCLVYNEACRKIL